MKLLSNFNDSLFTSIKQIYAEKGFLYVIIALTLGSVLFIAALVYIYITNLAGLHKNFLIFLITVTIIAIVFTFYCLYRFLYQNIIKIKIRLDSVTKRINLDMNYGISYHNKMLFLLDYLHNIVEQENSATLLHKEAMLTALQRQIDPHFLYNTLDAIRGLSYSEEAEKTAEMIECLSNLFRYITHESGKILPFKKELNNVEDYFHIQRFRFDNRFSLIQEIDKNDPDIMNCPIPAFTLQPIIENAIYHGLKDIKTDGVVKISATRTQRNLIITISDNGCGIDLSTLKKLNYHLRSNDCPASGEDSRLGIALTNVNTRIRLLFGQEYGLSVSSAAGFGTTVEIVLPNDTNYINSPVCSSLTSAY